jgi:hypothetical protein
MIIPRNNLSYGAGKLPGNLSLKLYNHLKIELGRGPKYPIKSLYEQKRRLCWRFKHEDKYIPGHQCNSKGLYMMERLEDEHGEFLKVTDGEKI